MAAIKQILRSMLSQSSLWMVLFSLYSLSGYCYVITDKPEDDFHSSSAVKWDHWGKTTLSRLSNKKASAKAVSGTGATTVGFIKDTWSRTYAVR
ncbi:hypothetical protein CPK_ORF00206 [Chlamydia pneumoniae LPCoLN]|nr:hypothetical protein [Chlamydia pneumoniae]ACZ32689.1 hypothetical protein CPK_ORF00206 [Chlamydia pneumoniae LPCoLN]ETR79549.1 hypothetical protein X556_1122 [Chlamydia pneumoniae B21]